MSGADLPGVPRRLRDRDVPPGDEDPLLASSTRPTTSPASGRSRPGSTWRPSCARAGCPLLTLESARRCRLRRGRLLAAVRAHLHERPHAARPRGHPAARRRSRRRRAADHRRRSDGDAPRAARALHRRLLHRRGRGAAAGARASGRGAAARGRAAARAPDPAGRAYPLYVPELYETELDDDTGLPRRRRAGGSARARASAAASGSTDSTASRSPTIRRCRTPRRSSIAWRSRWRAAAPRGAASARRG